MLMGITITLFILVSVFLILLILIQKGRGGGLASAFGGAGGNTAFGSKTGDVLTWATSIVFGIFLVLAVGLNLLAKSSTDTASTVTPGDASETQQADPQVPPASGLPPAVPAPGPTGVGLLGSPAQPPDQPTNIAAPAGAPVEATPAAPAPTTQPK